MLGSIKELSTEAESWKEGELGVTYLKTGSGDAILTSSDSNKAALEESSGSIWANSSHIPNARGNIRGEGVLGIEAPSS